MAEPPPRGRRRKWLLGALAAVVATLALLRGLAPVAVARVLVDGIESRTGLQATVGGVDLSILARRIVLEDVRIRNPEGFENADFLRLGYAEIDLGSISRGETDRLVVRGLDVRFEETADGRRTTDSFLRRTESDSADTGEERQKGTGKKAKGRNRRLAVEHVEIANASVTFLDRKRSGNEERTTLVLEALDASGLRYEESEDGRPVVECLLTAGPVRWTWKGAEIVAAAGVSLDARNRTAELVIDSPLYRVATDTKAVTTLDRAKDLMESFFEDDAEEDAPPTEEDSGDGSKEKKKDADDSKSYIDALVVGIEDGSYVRAAEIGDASLESGLANIDGRFEWRRGSGALSLDFAADGPGGSRCIDLSATGTGFAGGETPDYSFALSLDGFPWHMMQWPTDSDDIVQEDGPLVRHVLVSGDFSATGTAERTAAHCAFVYSEIDVRPDTRPLRRRLGAPIASPATWLGELAGPSGGPTPEVAFDFESDEAIHPLLLQTRLRERFVTARFALFGSQSD